MAITASDYLYQIQELTQQNLSILKTINDSFFTNANHLTAAIGDTTYTIPSFLALENKINALRDDFDNIVKLPQTGEAYFTFDGVSRVISVNGYNNTPERYVLDPSGGTSGYRYNIEQNDVLKDFLTPKPYVQLDLSDMPNDITAAIVKKVTPLTDELKKRFAGLLGENTNTPMTWEEMYKILAGYADGTDYVEYDTTMRLPARKSIGSATYVIKEITKDEITSDLEEYITIRLVGTADAGLSETGDTSFTKTLTYTLFDGTMEKELAVGDKLTTYDGSAMMEIVELYPSSNTLVVKVLNGDYVNLSVAGEVLPTYFDDNAKLRFFSSPFDIDDKYIRVPLEEDEYVYVVVAPYNERLNIRAPWGGGLLFDVYKLPGDAGEFKKYYDDNVRNIGDILSDITSMMPDSLTRFSTEEFLAMTSAKPVLDTKNLQVVQINTHLNESATIQQVRRLYNDKLTIKQNIEELDTNIADVKKIISTTAFNDTTGIRSSYMNTLNKYNADRNTYTISLRNVINSIAESANSADVPIDNAKYHIRGFFDYKSLEGGRYRVKRIYVEYRYKNTNNTTGKAMTFGEEQNFLFSDWNIMESHANPRIASHDGSRYVFLPKGDNGNVNEPSFNQIDIPISQGESVDIRLKVIYDYCYPFAEVTSAFSDIVTIEFPDELKQDISILDIIEENNKDAETYKMENILSSKGVTAHVNDSVEDQDITYFHSPEHIASGSYTAERRVIPLSDKLAEISNAILELQDTVAGTMSTNVDVALYIGEQRISPAWTLRNPITRLKSYDAVIGGQFDGYVIRQLPDAKQSSVLKPVVEAAVSIVIKNTSQHVVSLYPMFPGNDGVSLDKSTAYSVFSNVKDQFSGVKFRVKASSPNSNDTTESQRLNQFINFRSNNPYDKGPYSAFDTKDIIPTLANPSVTPGIMHLCPYLSTTTDLCMSLDAVRAQTLFPGKSITIPLRVQYYYEGPGQEDKTIGFDIWTSLYSEPIHYEFTIRTMKESTIDDVIIVNPRDINTGTYIPITK